MWSAVWSAMSMFLGTIALLRSYHNILILQTHKHNKFDKFNNKKWKLYYIISFSLVKVKEFGKNVR